MTELKQHADALMQFLQQRGLSVPEAVDAMGVAIICLVGDEETLEFFVKQLRDDYVFNRGRDLKH